MRGTLLGGRYRLEDCIGSGGMGTVWSANDERLGREVAVKTLSGPAPGDDAARQMAVRFEREARYAARLSSPHIVTVHDYGEHDVTGRTVLYLVMERVTGRPLHRVLREDGPLPPPRVAALARQMCAGLATAHASGVVHRDIKPSNVMVDADDQVTLLDFGIARTMRGDGAEPTVTAVGDLVGTAPYMSPEQAKGVKELDARSDLYALGCVLYAMLTGDPPFPDGEWSYILLRHLTDPPPPPSSHRPELPTAWDTLLLDLLAKDPDARPADAKQVGRRLAELETAARTAEAGTRAEAVAGGRAGAPPHPPTRVDAEGGGSSAAALADTETRAAAPRDAGAGQPSVPPPAPPPAASPVAVREPHRGHVPHPVPEPNAVPERADRAEPAGDGTDVPVVLHDRHAGVRTVVRWLKREGERVVEGEPLLRILTSRENNEITAPVTGVLRRILVAEGTTVAVGTTLAVIRTPRPVPAPSTAAADADGAPVERPRGDAASQRRLSPAAARVLGLSSALTLAVGTYTALTTGWLGGSMPAFVALVAGVACCLFGRLLQRPLGRLRWRAGEPLDSASALLTVGAVVTTACVLHAAAYRRGPSSSLDTLGLLGTLIFEGLLLVSLTAAVFGSLFVAFAGQDRLDSALPEHPLPDSPPTVLVPFLTGWALSLLVLAQLGTGDASLLALLLKLPLTWVLGVLWALFATPLAARAVRRWAPDTPR